MDVLRNAASMEQDRLNGMLEFLLILWLVFTFYVIWLGFDIFWVVAYMKGDAANNVDDGDSDCTEMPTILKYYFICESILYMWTIMKRTGQFNEETTKSTAFKICDFGIGFAVFYTIICGVDDYYGLDEGCQHYIQREGSDLLWTAYAIWFYFHLVYVIIVLILGIIACIFVYRRAQQG
eukprot:UN34494